MSSSSGASAPIFSYAQAARGLASAASTQSTSRNESPAASDKSLKDRSLGHSTNASSAAKSPRLRSEADDKATGQGATLNPPTNAEGTTSVLSTFDATDSEGATQKQDASTTDHPQSLPVAQIDATSDQDLRKDVATSRSPDGREASTEASYLVASHDQTTQNVSEKKARDGEDNWEKVTVPSMPAESQYKAAPIPPVNVWQVRRDAQAARMKEHPKPIVPGNSSLHKKSRSASEELKRKPTSKEVGSNEREGKHFDSITAAHRKDMPSGRSSGPTSQQGEKAEGEALPPVIDTNSWPTPENSNVEDRRRSASYEKVDSKTGSQKAHVNKWRAVPFVPTAKFETQLPPAAARRGGRHNTRGRDTGGRGDGHAGTPGGKQDAVTSMGPPPLPRPSGEQDRGRQPEGQQSVRGASVPNSRTRPTSNGDPTGMVCHSAAADNMEQSTSEIVGNVSPAAQPTFEQQITRTERSSRSSSRHTGNAGGLRMNGERVASMEQNVGGFTQSKEPVLRYSMTYDRNKAHAAGNSRGNGKIRDWSREKSESAREKVESWRDRDSSGDQGNRRGNRSERGRGNPPYRGRGDHTYNAPFASSHAYTAPLPQNGFEPPSRSTSHTESRSRQTSQPFVPTQATSAARNTARSQSIPIGMLPGYYNGMAAMPQQQQGLANIQTDMSMYGYPSQMQMQPSIMTAMPYNDPLNSYALLSMVMTQM